MSQEFSKDDLQKENGSTGSERSLDLVKDSLHKRLESESPQPGQGWTQTFILEAPEDLWDESWLRPEDAYVAPDSTLTVVTSVTELIQANAEWHYLQFDVNKDQLDRFGLYRRARFIWQEAKLNRRALKFQYRKARFHLPLTFTSLAALAFCAELQREDHRVHMRTIIHRPLPGLGYLTQSPATTHWHHVENFQTFFPEDWQSLQNIHAEADTIVCEFRPDFFYRHSHQFVGTVTTPSNSKAHNVFYVCGENYHRLLNRSVVKQHVSQFSKLAQAWGFAPAGQMHLNHFYYTHLDVLPLKMEDLFATTQHKQWDQNENPNEKQNQKHKNKEIPPSYQSRLPLMPSSPVQVTAEPILTPASVLDNLAFNCHTIHMEEPTYGESAARQVKSKGMRDLSLLFSHRSMQYKLYNTFDRFKQLVKMQVNLIDPPQLVDLDTFFRDPKLALAKQLAETETFLIEEAERRAVEDELKTKRNKNLSLRYKEINVADFETAPQAIDEDALSYPNDVEKPKVNELLFGGLLTDTYFIHFKQAQAHLPGTPYPGEFPMHVPLDPVDSQDIYIRQELDDRYSAPEIPPSNPFTVVPKFQRVLFNYLQDELSGLETTVNPTILGKRQNPWLRLNPTQRWQAWQAWRGGASERLAFQRAARVRKSFQIGQDKLLKRRVSGYLFPDMTAKRCQVFMWHSAPFWQKFRSGPSTFAYEIRSLPWLNVHNIEKLLLGQFAFESSDLTGLAYVQPEKGFMMGAQAEDLGWAMGAKTEKPLKPVVFNDIEQLNEEKTVDALYDYVNRPKFNQYDQKVSFRAEDDDNDNIVPYPLDYLTPDWVLDNHPRATKDITSRPLTSWQANPNLINPELLGRLAVGHEDKLDRYVFSIPMTSDRGFEPHNFLDQKDFGYPRVEFQTRTKHDAALGFILCIGAYQCFVTYVYAHRINQWLKLYTKPLISAIRDFVYTGSPESWEHLRAKSGMVQQSKVDISKLIGIQTVYAQFYSTIVYFRSLKHPFRYFHPPGLDVDKRDVEKNRVARAAPKAFLMVGPPGTGKTFLAQAFAHESRVPVVLYGQEKMPRALDPEDEFRTGGEFEKAVRLDHLFETAYDTVPCIVFIDEIDGLAPRRPRVSQGKSSTGVGLVYGQNTYRKYRSFVDWGRRLSTGYDLNRTNYEYWVSRNQTMTNLGYFNYFPNFFSTIALSPVFHPDLKDQPEELSEEAWKTLTKLLLEIDNLYKHPMAIIGATNRPDVLDPALLRPGRLHNVLYVDLPGKQKRLDLLKFYSEDKLLEPIDWDYLAQQSSGLSPADLHAAINISGFNCIYHYYHEVGLEYKWPPVVKKVPKALPKGIHTTESIQHGFESVQYVNTLSAEARFAPLCLKYNRHVYPVQHHCSQWFNQRNKVHFCLVGALTPTELTALYYQPGKKVFDRIPEDINVHRTHEKLKYQTQTKDIRDLFAGQWHQPHLKAPVTKKEGLSMQRQRLFKRVQPAFKKALILAQAVKATQSSTPHNQFSSDMQVLIGFVKFVQRMFKFHLFGLQMLLDTPCSPYYFACLQSTPAYKKVENQLIQTDIEFAAYPAPVAIMQSLLNLKQSLFETNPSATAETKIWGDPHRFGRAAYYQAGRALVSQSLKHTPSKIDAIRLWHAIQPAEIIDKPQVQLIKELLDQCHTRAEFEGYLLMLLAGKAGENFLLAHQVLPSQEIKEPSDMGNVERANWVANIMAENNLFYHLDSFDVVTRQFEQPSLEDAYLDNRTSKLKVIDRQRHSGPVEEVEEEERMLAKNIGHDPDKPFLRRKNMTHEYWWRTMWAQKEPYRGRRHFDNRIWTRINPHQRLHFPTPEYPTFFMNSLTDGQIVSWSTKRWKFYGPMKYPNIRSIHRKQNVWQTATATKFFKLGQVYWNQIKAYKNQHLVASILGQSYETLYSVLDTHTELLDFLAFQILTHDELKPNFIQKTIDQWVGDQVHWENFMADFIPQPPDLCDDSGFTDPVQTQDPACASIQDALNWMQIESSSAVELYDFRPDFFDGCDVTERSMADQPLELWPLPGDDPTLPTLEDDMSYDKSPSDDSSSEESLWQEGL